MLTNQRIASKLYAGIFVRRVVEEAVTKPAGNKCKDLSVYSLGAEFVPATAATADQVLCRPLFFRYRYCITSHVVSQSSRFLGARVRSSWIIEPFFDREPFQGSAHDYQKN